METKEILAERAKTHGRFCVVADVAQDIKTAINNASNNRSYMNVSQREAIDMIASKLGRICSGNPHEIDHWQDIAGYALLVVDELKKKQGLEE